MGPNKYMHPRNIYKTPPDFKQLAIDYPEFRKHAVQDLTGKVQINFKDSNSLRALTRTLLKKDFELDVDIPPDRLIPTVPQRLNYILWLEDLLEAQPQKDIKRGIDIGTGASCIFPLLGSKINGWQFLASESDPDSFDCAQRNVQRNGLQDKVEVIQVTPNCCLQELMKDQEEKFDFCMCNPPFFCDSFDASWKCKSRKATREEPLGSNTAAQQEAITEGGEVSFVKRIVEDSVRLKEKIRIYTSMLGKKASVGLVKQELVDKHVPHFVTTEFQQGKTLRWGVAWTFCSGLKLNKIALPKHVKPLQPLSFFVPSTIKQVKYSVFGILNRTEELLTELNLTYHIYERREAKCQLWLRSQENTWSHQRRKKRQQIKMQETPTNGGASSDVPTLNNGLSTSHDGSSLTQSEEGGKRKSAEYYGEGSSSKKVKETETEETLQWLLFADIVISSAGKCVVLEFRARREMKSRETLHQIMQFFKNKLV